MRPAAEMHLSPGGMSSGQVHFALLMHPTDFPDRRDVYPTLR